MLKTRILVALLFLPVFVCLILLATPWPWFALVACALVLAAVEFNNMSSQRQTPLRLWLVLPVVLGLAALAACSQSLPGRWPENVFAFSWLLLVALLLALLALDLAGGFSEVRGFSATGANLLAILTIGSIGVFVILLRLLPHGAYWLLILFGFNWIYDGAALFSGKYFGKHLLAPAISPAKTVEGLLGGLAAAVLAAVIFYGWPIPRSLGFSLPGFMLAAMALGLLSQAGDLIESMLKRWSGCKDASSLIPGHGGILDKIDNLCFTAPLLFALAWWMTRP